MGENAGEIAWLQIGKQAIFTLYKLRLNATITVNDNVISYKLGHVCD